MPTAAFNTFTGKKLVPFINPHLSAVLEIKIAASKTLLAGTIMAEVTATPGVYDAYANGGAGGLAAPKGILMYDATTDASGNITNWSGPYASVPADINMPMYVAGVFLTTDIVGSPTIITTAMAEALPMGKLIQGSATTGLYLIAR